MVPVSIKRNYTQEAKSVLERIRPYTRYVDDFHIIIRRKKDSPFNSFYFQLRWKDTRNDWEKHEIDLTANPNWRSDKVACEVIEALNLADKTVFFEVEYYY